MMVSLNFSPAYPTVQSPTTPGQQSYPGGITDWSRASFIPSPCWQGQSHPGGFKNWIKASYSPRWQGQPYPVGIANWSSASFIPSPRWQGPSSYAPWLLHRLNALFGLLGSVLPSETQQQTVRNSQIYGTSWQGESANAGSPGKFDALQRKNVLPERPGQPECQFDMETGDCKNVLPVRLIPASDYVLNPTDRLPQRPDNPECLYYMRTGYCKFGALCKFHHPGPIPASDCVSNPTDLPSQRENVYPERPDEAECRYYMRTGFCAYGAKCRFHHPRERLIPASETASSEKHDDPDEPKRLVSKI